MARSIIPAAFVAGALVLAVTAPAATETSVRKTPCGPVRVDSDVKSQLKVSGNKMVDSKGNVVVPYGISLVSGPETTNWARSEKAVHAQIVASHRYWHANIVRVQVSENELFKNPTPGHSYNVKFAASVNRLVCAVIKQGQIAVINDNP